MSERIVNPFEMIQVDHEYRNLRAVAPRQFHCLHCLVLQQRASQVDDLIVMAKTEGMATAQKSTSAKEIRAATLLASTKIDELQREEDNLLASRRGTDERLANDTRPRAEERLAAKKARR